MKKNIINLLFIMVLFLAGSISCTIQPDGEAISNDNIVIKYDVQGKGEPVLVFIHGWCCDKSYWKYQVPEFSKNHKVVTIDLGGHGESDLNREKWTIEAFGNDVAAVIEDLKLEKVILVGHSMGGAVILETARHLQGKVLALIGVDTYQNFEERFSEQQMNQFLAPFKDDFVNTTKKFVRSMFPVYTDSSLVTQIVEDMSSASPEVGIGAMKELFSYDAIEALKEVRIPIHSINSDRYPVSVEKNRKYAGSYHVKFMKRVGHFIMLEDPFTFNKLLKETIGEI